MTETIIAALIAAASTLVVGTVAGVWALLQARGKRQASLRAQAQQVRAQAEQVRAWWLRRLDSGDAGVAVQNSSTGLVYYANVIVAGHGDICWRNKSNIGDLAPSQNYDLWSREKIYRLRQRSVNCSERRPTGTPPDVEIIFKDANKRYWLRTRLSGEQDGGDLIEVDSRLAVWCEAKRAEVLKPQLMGFGRTYDIHVEFTEFKTTELLQREFNALRGRKGVPEPDILVGPHDWLGWLVSDDRLHPIVLSEAQYDSFHRVASRAMMIQGQIYGIPYAFDSVALFINLEKFSDEAILRELTTDRPQELTLDRVIEISQDRGFHDHPVLVQVGENGDPYHMWPMWWSAGGDLLGLDYEGYHTPRRQELTRVFAEMTSLARRNVFRTDVGRNSEQDIKGALDLFCEGESPFSSVRRAHCAKPSSAECRCM